MSWIQKLCETYESVDATADQSQAKPWPVSHLSKKAHVEVVLDASGAFRRASKLSRSESLTLIPATEASAGRTSGIAAHPLCEELSYCAGDLPQSATNRFAKYKDQLRRWCDSPLRHPKAEVVLKYVTKGTLWTDLGAHNLLPLQVEDARGSKTKVADEKVFVRWRVEDGNDPCSGTWEDGDLIQRWINFDRLENQQTGFCMVTGDRRRLCRNHSRFVRRSDDGGKLISANDFAGFTFRGRLTDEKDDYEKQACSVGFNVSQKAHNALRWLIARQGSRNGDQVVVSWASSAVPIPDPMVSTYELLGVEASQTPNATVTGDAGQAFALRLSKAIKGYRARLEPTEDVMVMGVDSATPGRMAVTYYREVQGSEFLERIETWHLKCAWHQNFGKDRHFVGAPAPKDIAEVAFGKLSGGKPLQVDDSLFKSTIERLLPCIVDGQAIPHDLVLATSRRASNRTAFKPSERWEWEKCLGIACALFKGYHMERNYRMALEPDRTTRDYLYGRLLAIAESIESYALYVAGEPRDTNAARLMQRFSDRPFSTWKTIEISLAPYKSRLRAKRGPWLRDREQLLTGVTSKFSANDYVNDTPLTGEFLLGYHCQRQELQAPKPIATVTGAAISTPDNDE